MTSCLFIRLELLFPHTRIRSHIRSSARKRRFVFDSAWNVCIECLLGCKKVLSFNFLFFIIKNMMFLLFLFRSTSGALASFITTFYYLRPLQKRSLRRDNASCAVGTMQLVGADAITMHHNMMRCSVGTMQSTVADVSQPRVSLKSK